VHVVSDIYNVAPAVRNQMPWFLALFVIDHLVNVGDIQDTDRYYGHCLVAVDIEC
jgi:hypothetical protein